MPLENRHDFLTLATGKKIQVPFEQLIIFSTNLEPTRPGRRGVPAANSLQDRGEGPVGRRSSPGCSKRRAESFGCRFFPEAVHYLVQTHYAPHGRPLRRCQPRDLLSQIKNYCVYYGRPMELRPDYLDRVVKSYFTAVAPRPSDCATTSPVRAPHRETELRQPRRTAASTLGHPAVTNDIDVNIEPLPGYR